jgi:hypothetical protein
MKKLPLSKGYVAVVDDEDFERVGRFKWHARVHLRADGTIKSVYARRNVVAPSGVRTGELLHRVILGVTDPKIQIDHRDHDGLNCRRFNLRTATVSQNQCNGKKRCDNTTGFKGVYWYEKYHKWNAQICASGQRKNLGYYDTPEKAAKAYDSAAIEHHGEFALINFPNASSVCEEANA